jgi:hypothetical protein
MQSTTQKIIGINDSRIPKKYKTALNIYKTENDECQKNAECINITLKKSLLLRILVSLSFNDNRVSSLLKIYLYNFYRLLVFKERMSTRLKQFYAYPTFTLLSYQFNLSVEWETKVYKC